MIFGIEETIAYLSQGTTLERGSLIMTGTPPGIGVLRDPKVVLQHGDDMRVEIEGIGSFFFFFLCHFIAPGFFFWFFFYTFPKKLNTDFHRLARGLTDDLAGTGTLINEVYYE